MCTQSVGLVAAEVERAGIATTCIALVAAVARAVRPPRALAVPFPFGLPLAAANDPPRQRGVVEAALRLLERGGTGPVVEEYRE